MVEMTVLSREFRCWDRFQVLVVSYRVFLSLDVDSSTALLETEPILE